MKTKEELNELKEEVEKLDEKLHELTEEELAQVTGGVIAQVKNGAISTLPDEVELPDACFKSHGEAISVLRGMTQKDDKGIGEAVLLTR